MTKRVAKSLRTRLLMAALLLPLISQVEYVNAQSCNLNGKQIIYRLQICEHGSCQSGVEMLRVLGSKILSYKGPSGAQGDVFEIGQPVRIDPDLSPPPPGTGTHRYTTLMATYENNVLRLTQDTVSITPNVPNGRVLSIFIFEILPRCTFCRMHEGSIVATLADGTFLGQKRYVATSCYVSDIPLE